MLSESELIKRSIKGDVSSFELLIGQYQKLVYNLALRYFNQDDAQDVAQEILIKVYKNIKNFREESSFKTYLFTIATNTCKDELRKQKRNQTSPMEYMDDEENTKGYSDATYCPVDQLEKKELQENLKSAIENLPEQYRSAVIMRDVLGYSYEEISRIEGCPTGTVKSRIKRGREHLREAITRGERRGENENQMS